MEFVVSVPLCPLYAAASAGAERVDAVTLAYEADDWYEVNRFLLFAI